MAFKRLVIVGYGLIGASLALAAKRAGRDLRCVAVDLPERLSPIRQLGVADAVESIENLENAVVGADLVVVATPAHVVEPVLRRLAACLPPDALVTDVAGTKASICAVAIEALGGRRFIGGHPMAGSERSGAAAADPTLFHQKPWVLCPMPGVEQDRLLALMGFVEGLGGRPITLDPTEHDRLTALISHVPQLLATALMMSVDAAVNDRELALKLAGNGFRDMTRIAASDFGQWEGILATNQAEIARVLDLFQDTLAEVRERMRSGDLRERWEKAASARRKIVDRTLAAVPRKSP